MTDYNKLVAGLKYCADDSEDSGSCAWCPWRDECLQPFSSIKLAAADAIEALQAELNKGCQLWKRDKSGNVLSVS